MSYQDDNQREGFGTGSGLQGSKRPKIYSPSRTRTETLNYPDEMDIQSMF
jgi:hypothetical protein